LITGGVSEDGITPGKPSLILLFLKAGVVPPQLYETGVKLVTAQFERYIPVAKSLNYMTAVVTMQK
jgi:branched-chain amino acid aminotransferase